MLLPSLLVCVTGMMVGCSVSDEEYVDLRPHADNSMIINSTFEGEWSVNKQVVDTARMVMGDKVRVHLPEDYLLGLLLTNEEASTKAQPDHKPTEITLTEQGYSDNSIYLMFDSPKTEGSDGQLMFCSSSFGAVIGGAPCNVSLLSKENASAVMQQTSGQWTLAIPIDAIRVTDRNTGQQRVVKMPIAFTLYYNTKRRLD